jgi:hypothetical protein
LCTSDRWIVYDEQDPWHIISSHDSRRDAEDAAWLMTARYRYGTSRLRKAFHRLFRSTPYYRVEIVRASRRDDDHSLPHV